MSLYVSDGGGWEVSLRWRTEGRGGGGFVEFHGEIPDDQFFASEHGAKVNFGNQTLEIRRHYVSPHPHPTPSAAAWLRCITGRVNKSGKSVIYSEGSEIVKIKRPAEGSPEKKEIHLLQVRTIFSINGSEMKLGFGKTNKQIELCCAGGRPLLGPPTQVCFLAKQRTDCYSCEQAIFTGVCDLKRVVQWKKTQHIQLLWGDSLMETLLLYRQCVQQKCHRALT